MQNLAVWAHATAPCSSGDLASKWDPVGVADRTHEAVVVEVEVQSWDGEWLGTDRCAAEGAGEVGKEEVTKMRALCSA